MLSNLLALNEAQWVVYWIGMITCLVLIFIAALVAIFLVLFQKSNSDGIQGITASS